MPVRKPHSHRQSAARSGSAPEIAPIKTAQLLDQFVEIGQRVNAEEIVELTVGVAAGLPGAVSVGLWWLSQDGRELNLAGYHGNVPKRPAMVRRRSKLWTVLTTATPVRVPGSRSPLKMAGRTVVIAPIGDEFHQLGLLVIGFSEEPADAVASVSAIARQSASSATNSARLRQLLDSNTTNQQQVQKLQNLHRALDRLGRVRNEEALLKTIPELACQSLGYSYVLLETIAGNQLQFVSYDASHPSAKQVATSVFKQASGQRIVQPSLIEEVVRTKAPVIIDDLHADRRVRSSIVRRQLANLAVAPILDENGRVAAILHLAHARVGPHALRLLPADLELLNVFTQLCSFSLSNIRYTAYRQQGIDIAKIPARTIEEFTSEVVQKLPGLASATDAVIALPGSDGTLVPVATSDPSLLTKSYRKWLRDLPFSRQDFNPRSTKAPSSLGIEHSILSPIRYEDEYLGLVHLPAKTTGTFTRHDADVVDTATSRIGYVIKNLEFVHRLSRETRLFSSIVQNTADGIISLDSDESIRFFNQAMEIVTGFKASEVLGRSATEIFEPQADDGESFTFGELMESGTQEASARTLSIVTQSGERKWVGITATPRVSVEGTQLTIMVIRDVTEEHRLMQRQREFVSIASHELRTPITALMGYLSLIQSTPDDDHIQRGHFVERAYAAANRLSELVEDLLAAARIEEGRLSLTVKPVNPAEVAKDVVQNLAPAATGKKQKLTVTNRLPHAAQVTADRSKLHQVIANLVDNAIKYTPEGGSITVSLSTGKKSLSVTVRDSGIGIHPDNLDRIFDKFFREYTDLSVAAGGTGLGLFITRELAERQGGQLTITSRQGRGTVARVKFPLASGSPDIGKAAKKRTRS